MRRPFRLFLVPGWAVAVCFAVCFLFASMEHIAFWMLKLPYKYESDPHRKFIPTALCYFGYGCLRVINDNTPWVPTRFTQWLLTTPWTSVKPLPFNPAHLAWQDGLILLLSVPIALVLGVSPIECAAVSAVLVVGAYLICTAGILRILVWLHRHILSFWTDVDVRDVFNNGCDVRDLGNFRNRIHCISLRRRNIFNSVFRCEQGSKARV